MRIILSPAKQMISNTDILDYSGLPVFLDRAEEIAMHKLGRKPELIELNRRAFKAGADVVRKIKEAGECR